MVRIINDLVYGARALRHWPGLSILAILMLGLGIGATVGIFTVVRSVILAPLQYPASERIVAVSQNNPQLGGLNPFASANYLAVQEGSTSFQFLAAYQRRNLTLTGYGDPLQVQATRVTPTFFEVLATWPQIGRGFSREEAAAANPAGMIVGHNPVAILSHGLWVNRFGARPDIVGSTIVLDDRAHEVIGVMPAGFQFPSSTEIWVPLVFGDVARRDFGGFFLDVVGRLAPNVTAEQAQVEVNEIAARIQNASPPNEGLTLPLTSLKSKLVGDIGPTLFILFGITGLLLLVICGNLANILLAQASSRQREIAIRIALGAEKKHIIRQMLAESLVLAWCGTGVGLLFSQWSLGLLLRLAPDAIFRTGPIKIDLWVLAFSLLTGTLTGIIFGLAPALHLWQPDLQRQLLEGGRGTSASRRQRRLQGLLITSEIAMSLLLLIATGLLVRSYWKLASEDLGFRPAGLLAIDITLPQKRYPNQESQASFVSHVVEEVRALPGIASAGVALRLPVVSGGGGIWFQTGSSPPKDAPLTEVTFQTVTPGYFELMGIPLEKGRDIDDHDRTGSLPVVLISKEFARRYFPNQDAIGQQLILTPWPGKPRQIVGIAGDVKQDGLASAVQPALYVPYAQIASPTLSLIVRSTGGPQDLLQAVRSRIWSVDQQLAFKKTDTIEARLSDALKPARFTMWLVGTLGLLGLLLSAFGIYGVAAFVASQRTHEIGIRMALGADPKSILRLMIRGEMVWILCGLGLGIAAAFAVTRVASRLLYQISPADPITFAATVVILAGVALGAIYVPARRAARVNPAELLRYE